MAINFPNSPATNDTFVGPTGIEYIYDGVKWRSFKPTEPVIGTFNANSAISLTAGGTNQNITLTPSGTGIVTVPSSVGIGTTTPASKLQVTTTDGAAPVNTSGSNALRLRSTATAAVGVGPSILFEGQTGNTTANYGFAAIQAFKGSATAADYSGALAFYTQNSGGATGLTERMRIDALGNVGIGGTSSTERLEVYGSASAKSISSGTVSVIAQTGTATDYSILRFRQTTTESRIEALSVGTAASNPLTFVVGASERIRIAANGNIGIATTTPSVPLNVAVFGVSNVPLATNAVVRIEQGSTGSSETTLQIVARDQSGGGAAIHFGVGALAASTRIASFGGTTGLIIQENSGGPIILNAGGERIRITSTGSVGIGNTAPTRALDIAGAGATIGLVNTSAGGNIVSIDAPTGGIAQIDVGGANVLRLNTNSIERVRVNSAANSISIGTATSFAHTTTVSAIDLGTAGGVNYVDASSLNLVVNGYWNGTNWIYKTTNPSSILQCDITGKISAYTAVSGTAAANIAYVERARIDVSGNMYINSGTLWKYAPAPTALTAGANAITAAGLQGQIFTVAAAVTTAVTFTLPLATAIDTFFPQVSTTNIGLDFYIINAGVTSAAVTVAVNTGITLGAGSLTVAIGTSAQFRLRRTAANTYLLYRMG